jgi:hypothetical protein
MTLDDSIKKPRSSVDLKQEEVQIVAVKDPYSGNR